MAIHYNAFISYRHHPEDIKVAEQIQRYLERYRVPKAIRKQGKKLPGYSGIRKNCQLPVTCLTIFMRPYKIQTSLS